MNILAIDLGTTTGWALAGRDGIVKGGSERFAPKSNESQAQRWMKFRRWLSDLGQSAGEINVVYYERVLHHSAVQAAHVYGGLEALLQIWCEVNRVRMVTVSPGTIKKHWTGKGNADKAAMIAAARAKGLSPVDDNHADALALLSYAREQELELADAAF